MTGAIAVVVFKYGAKIADMKMKVVGLHTTFNRIGTRTTSGKLKIPMAIQLQESDMVIPGCVHSHELPEKTHPFFVSQACQSQW